MELPLARLVAVCLVLALARASELQREARTRNHVCSTWGDFHYKTFDGDVFRFPGLCDYNFASDCRDSYKEFAVHLKRGLDQAGGYPRIESILITIKDDTIYLTHKLAVVNGAMVSTPHYSSGLLIEKNDAYTKVYSRAGLSLMWNREDALMLELDSRFQNHTCGLCGDFNGMQTYNEFLSEGIQYSAIEFGNMQKINKPEVECEDPEVVQGPESCSEHRAECERLLTSTAFDDCQARVPMELYVRACMQDRCRCPQGGACECSTLAEFSRQCSHAGGRPENWRTASLCPKKCPGNMVYLESSSPCVDTCSHLEVSSLCEEHYMDGCFCPEGTVYDDITGSGCIPVSKCHCKLHGHLYMPGQEITNNCEQCVCNAGRWVCEALSCPETCALEGGSHITTFDGKKFTFHGDCYYVLTKGSHNDSYALLGELATCGSTDKQTCLKTVVLLTDNKKNVVAFKSGGSVLLNELEVTLPHVAASFSIFQPSSYHIVVNTVFGLRLQVQLVPVMQLFVTLDQAAQGQVQGLCGNFNGLESDDFMTSGGLVEATGAGFANTWKAQSSCHDKLDWLDDPCSLNIESANYAEHWCSLLKKSETPFARCHLAVDPTEYYKRCKYDTCNCQNNEDCMCAALSSYARACAAKGVMLWGWRERVCNKDVHACPSSQIFLYNLTTCQQTCRSLSEGDTHCLKGFAPVEGCGCPDHTFMDEKGRCVPLAKCSCYHHGLYLEAGDVILRQEERCICRNGRLQCTQVKLIGHSCNAPKILVDCNNLTALATRRPRPTSCQTLVAGYYHTECISGCVCPDGLLDDGHGGCVKEEDCPCIHNKDLYKPGDEIKLDCNNTCTCQRGRWECTRYACHSTCSIYGSGHYITFDGKHYDFDGHCSYVAVQDYCGQNSTGSFSIITENVPCGTTGVTCSKAIKIFIGGTELKLVDKHRVIKQLEEGHHVPFITREVGLYLVVEASSGIIIIWDKRTTIFIKLAPSYKGTVCGLCGNFDDQTKNDFTTRDHMVVTSELDFGNSWKEASTCPDVTHTPDPCSLNPHRRSWAEKQCSIIKSGVFKGCHSKVDPTVFYEACVHDSCSCDTGGDCECFCSAVASYAQECTKAEACVFWRTPDLCPVFCDYYNPPDECEWHYEPCGNRTFETCRTINGIHSNISVSYLEGCYPRCPKDRPIYDEDLKRCVTEDKCGCYIEDTHYPPNASVPTDDICMSCICTNTSEIICRIDEGKIVNQTQDGIFCYWEFCGPNGTVEKHFNICASSTAPPSTLTSFTTISTPTPISTTTTTTTTTATVTMTTTNVSCCFWSDWINNNRPSDSTDGGERETFDSVCSAPEDIECRSATEPKLSWKELGQKVQCNVSVGFICRNEDQYGNGDGVFGQCYDYEIQVYCCYPREYCTTPTTSPTTSPTTLSTSSPTTSPTTTSTTSPTTTPTTSPTTTPNTSPTTTSTTSPTTTPTTSPTTTPTTSPTTSPTTTPTTSPTTSPTTTPTTSPTTSPTTTPTTSLTTTPTTSPTTTSTTSPTTTSTTSPTTTPTTSPTTSPTTTPTTSPTTTPTTSPTTTPTTSPTTTPTISPTTSPTTTLMTSFTTSQTSSSTTSPSSSPTTSTTTTPTTSPGTLTTTSPSTISSTLPTTSTPPTPCIGDCKWTGWKDSGKPTYDKESGDFELIGDACEPGWIVANISCRAVMYSNKPLDQLGQKVICDKNVGLVCRNSEQEIGGIIPMPVCLNYEINVECCSTDCTTTTQTSTITTVTSIPTSTSTVTPTPPSTTTETSTSTSTVTETTTPTPHTSTSTSTSTTTKTPSPTPTTTVTSTPTATTTETPSPTPTTTVTPTPTPTTTETSTSTSTTTETTTPTPHTSTSTPTTTTPQTPIKTTSTTMTPTPKATTTETSTSTSTTTQTPITTPTTTVTPTPTPTTTETSTATSTTTQTTTPISHTTTSTPTSTTIQTPSPTPSTTVTPTQTPTSTETSTSTSTATETTTSTPHTSTSTSISTTTQTSTPTPSPSTSTSTSTTTQTPITTPTTTMTPTPTATTTETSTETFTTTQTTTPTPSPSTATPTSTTQTATPTPHTSTSTSTITTTETPITTPTTTLTTTPTATTTETSTATSTTTQTTTPTPHTSTSTSTSTTTQTPRPTPSTTVTPTPTPTTTETSTSTSTTQTPTPTPSPSTSTSTSTTQTPITTPSTTVTPTPTATTTETSPATPSPSTSTSTSTTTQTPRPTPSTTVTPTPTPTTTETSTPTPSPSTSTPTSTTTQTTTPTPSPSTSTSTSTTQTPITTPSTTVTPTPTATTTETSPATPSPSTSTPTSTTTQTTRPTPSTTVTSTPTATTTETSTSTSTTTQTTTPTPSPSTSTSTSTTTQTPITTPTTTVTPTPTVTSTETSTPTPSPSTSTPTSTTQTTTPIPHTSTSTSTITTTETPVTTPTTVTPTPTATTTETSTATSTTTQTTTPTPSPSSSTPTSTTTQTPRPTPSTTVTPTPTATTMETSTSISTATETTTSTPHTSTSTSKSTTTQTPTPTPSPSTSTSTSTTTQTPITTPTTTVTPTPTATTTETSPATPSPSTSTSTSTTTQTPITTPTTTVTSTPTATTTETSTSTSTITEITTPTPSPSTSTPTSTTTQTPIKTTSTIMTPTPTATTTETSTPTPSPSTSTPTSTTQTTTSTPHTSTSTSTITTTETPITTPTTTVTPTPTATTTETSTATSTTTQTTTPISHTTTSTPTSTTTQTPSPTPSTTVTPTQTPTSTETSTSTSTATETTTSTPHTSTSTSTSTTTQTPTPTPSPSTSTSTSTTTQTPITTPTTTVTPTPTATTTETSPATPSLSTSTSTSTTSQTPKPTPSTTVSPTPTPTTTQTTTPTPSPSTSTSTSTTTQTPITTPSTTVTPIPTATTTETSTSTSTITEITTPTPHTSTSTSTSTTTQTPVTTPTTTVTPTPTVTTTETSTPTPSPSTSTPTSTTQTTTPIPHTSTSTSTITTTETPVTTPTTVTPTPTATTTETSTATSTTTQTTTPTPSPSTSTSTTTTKTPITTPTTTVTPTPTATTTETSPTTPTTTQTPSPTPRTTVTPTPTATTTETSTSTSPTTETTTPTPHTSTSTSTSTTTQTPSPTPTTTVPPTPTPTITETPTPASTTTPIPPSSSPMTPTTTTHYTTPTATVIITETPTPSPTPSETPTPPSTSTESTTRTSSTSQTPTPKPTTTEEISTSTNTVPTPGPTSSKPPTKPSTPVTTVSTSPPPSESVTLLSTPVTTIATSSTASSPGTTSPFITSSVGSTSSSPPVSTPGPTTPPGVSTSSKTTTVPTSTTTRPPSMSTPTSPTVPISTTETVTQTRFSSTTPTTLETTRTSSSGTVSVSPITSPSTSWTSTATVVICCVLNGTFYGPGELVYNNTLGDTCYYVNCSLDCEIQFFNWSCPSTPSTSTPSTPTSPLMTTPSTPSTTSSKSTPSTPKSTSSKSTTSTPTTTRRYECQDFDPPRQVNETWWLCNCTMAICKYDNVVEIVEKKCDPPPMPTCSNGLKPVRVVDPDGCCWHWECDCYCTGWGDPHFVTFDGLYYSYQGNCTYVLVEEIVSNVDNFGVYIDNYHCDVNDQVSCPRTLIVRHETQEVQIKTVHMMPIEVQVQVNKQVVALPYKKYGLQVYESGINFMVDIPRLGAQISYNGLSFSIRLPYQKFGNNTKGQCGTCTNNTADDCILPSGEIISNCEVAADQWLVTDPSKPHCPHNGFTTKRPAITTPGLLPKNCTVSPICQLIKDSLFSECHPFVPPKHYYEACLFDSCFVPGSGMECASVQAYAALCAKEGTCIDWRNHTQGACSVECPSHRVYQACAPAEEPTCQSSSSQNATVLVEGCFCPEGTTKFAPGYDVCVKTCGCVGPDYVPREFGEHFEFDCKDCVCLEGGSGIVCQAKKCAGETQTTCEEDGTYLVEEVNPDDKCCNITSCKCDTKLCKAEPPSCLLGFEAKSQHVPGKCCPVYSCEPKGVCVHQNAEYQPGSPVHSTKCQDCVCTNTMDNNTQVNIISCTHVPCNISCSSGFELVEVPGECCRKCQQTHCIMEGPNQQYLILKPGDIEKNPNDKCTFFSCIKINNQLISSVSNITCPDFNPSDCVPGSITYMPNGCCQTCIPKNHTTAPCSVTPVMKEISHNGCTKNVSMNYCSGACGTFAMYSAQVQALDHKCSCCKEERTSQRQVTLECPDGSELSHTYTHIESCLCQDTVCMLPQAQQVRVRRSSPRFLGRK